MNNLDGLALSLRSVALECKLGYPQARCAHLIRDHIAVNVHGRADVRVPHHSTPHGKRFHAGQKRGAKEIPISFVGMDRCPQKGV
jgi:hypothetical protein